MNKNKNTALILVAMLWCGISSTASALTFAINSKSDIVGSVQTITSQYGDSFDSIGTKFDIGIYELIEANPGVDPWEPRAGTTIVIPSQFILPPGPRKGIVINLAEMRLYYFHSDNRLVTTHPIGIGRKEWETPLSSGVVTEKKKDPSWRPPDSIRAIYDANNKYLPIVVPPGPENPLGKYAMHLSITGYLIHGTNMQGGIGIRSSSGCIRMHPEDIESLFYKVSIGDSVRIIHKPYKIGRHYNQVYVEVHEPLSGEYYNTLSDSENLQQAIDDAKLAGTISRERARTGATNSYGYPALIK